MHTPFPSHNLFLGTKVGRKLCKSGQVDEAVVLYRQGLVIMKGCSKFSLDDPVVEVVRTDLAELLNYMKR